MIINSELFSSHFSNHRIRAASHLIHTPSVLCKTFSPQKDMPPAGQAAKNPARENLGRDIGCSYQPVQPAGKHRCRRRASSRPLPLRHGRTIAESSMHWQDSLRRSPSPFPTCLQLISLSLGLDDNRLRIVAGPVETGLVRAIILNASSQQRTVSDIHFSRAADVE